MELHYDITKQDYIDFNLNYYTITRRTAQHPDDADRFRVNRRAGRARS